MKNKRAKAKPEQVEAETEDKKSKSFFDDFLNQIISEEEPLPYAEVEPNEEKKNEPLFIHDEEPKKVFSYDDIVEESNFIEKTSVYEDEPANDSTLKKEISTHLKSSGTNTGFDLRKAIIYSEILNRRYF